MVTKMKFLVIINCKDDCSKGWLQFNKNKILINNYITMKIKITNSIKRVFKRKKILNQK